MPDALRAFHFDAIYAIAVHPKDGQLQILTRFDAVTFGRDSAAEIQKQSRHRRVRPISDLNAGRRGQVVYVYPPVCDPCS